MGGEAATANAGDAPVRRLMSASTAMPVLLIAPGNVCKRLKGMKPGPLTQASYTCVPKTLSWSPCFWSSNSGQR